MDLASKACDKEEIPEVAIIGKRKMETRELMWLEMIQYHGLTEIQGPVSNKVIKAWYKELGYIYDDSTPWCGLTMCIMAARCGLQRSKTLDARSWMKIGNPILEPKIGHVVVYWRGKLKSGWQGHVGLFAGYNEDKTQIFTLGGNQGNTLCIRPYPVDSPEFGLLGFRELIQI